MTAAEKMLYETMLHVAKMQQKKKLHVAKMLYETMLHVANKKIKSKSYT